MKKYELDNLTLDQKVFLELTSVDTFVHGLDEPKNWSDEKRHSFYQAAAESMDYIRAELKKKGYEHCLQENHFWDCHSDREQTFAVSNAWDILSEEERELFLEVTDNHRANYL